MDFLQCQHQLLFHSGVGLFRRGYCLRFCCYYSKRESHRVQIESIPQLPLVRPDADPDLFTAVGVRRRDAGAARARGVCTGSSMGCGADPAFSSEPVTALLANSSSAAAAVLSASSLIVSTTPSSACSRGLANGTSAAVADTTLSRVRADTPARAPLALRGDAEGRGDAGKRGEAGASLLRSRGAEEGFTRIPIAAGCSFAALTGRGLLAGAAAVCGLESTFDACVAVAGASTGAGAGVGDSIPCSAAGNGAGAGPGDAAAGADETLVSLI